MDKNEKYEELPYLNYSKMILMILVVLYHSMVFWNGDWFTVISIKTQAKPLSYIATWLNTIHIYCFVLISGYLFYYLKYIKKKENYNNFSLFFRNKFFRLFIPYVCICIIWIIPFYLFFYNASLRDIFINYFLGVSPGQLWFLLMLFNLFIGSYFFSKIMIKNYILGIFISILLYFLSIVSNHYLNNYFQIFNVLKFLLFFNIGFVLCQVGNFTKKIHPILWLLLDIIIFTLYLIIFRRINIDLANIKHLMIKVLFDIILSIFGAIMSFNVITWLVCKFLKKCSIFEFISKRQMGIYLFHQQFIYITLYLLNDYINPYVLFLINFLVAFLGALLISSLFLLTKHSKIMIGEK